MEIFIINLIGATLRVSTPILLAAIGETYAERAGILNLGIEGTMFFGAFIGFFVADKSGSLWLGFLVAVLSGVVFGLLMALLTVTLGVNQHVSGLGITMLCTGLSLFAFRLNYGGRSIPPSIESFQQLAPFKNIPWLNTLTEQYLLTYVAFLVIVPLAWWLLYRTSFGLKIRSVGENPEAADAAGVNVFAVRYAALAIGGGLMAAGGAFLSLAQLGAFTHGIIAGRGWVAIAIVIFGNWNPVRAMWGALIFGGTSALQLRLQTMGLQLPIPYETFLALPYIVTIIALVLAGRNASYPAALLKPYRRE
ncbi:MAG TPA: ABC transporter permease [Anaerolineaceae bacterium]|nr:MAG: ABC transporter permease [Chloroflexi bacterium GWB2_54_36]HAL16289.1 ABC transporter permease [Anaerolineaceae bacterium]HBA91867.1 ABC transporter permease [Anaerolineaceae bacterium]